MNSHSNLIWPWWVRLSHWLVAAGVLALWLMSHLWLETGPWHRGLGYAVFVLVVMRIVAGLRTTHVPAQLHLPTQLAITQHLQQMCARKIESHFGHNPLGQWAIYLSWALIVGLAVTGWLSRTDALWGEDWPLIWHAGLSWGLLVLVLLHVLAVILISKLSKQHLIWQMLHGRFEIENRD